MNELSTLFSTGLGSATMQEALLCMLLAFVLGKLIALTYERTYEGLSYARSFVQALVLGALVSSLLMLAIGDNLARGLGILGTMALVRFRTNVRDARDMVFIFAALAIGVSCGVRAYAIAVVGAVMFSLAAVAVDWTPFGRRQRFDGMLRFWLPRDGAGGEAIQATLEPYCRTYVLVALRDLAQGEALEYAYQVQLREAASHDQLVKALGALPGIGGLTLLLKDAHTEL